jgi:3-oxoacid CoA-transferase subunit A/glutaconate CoA-transferase subunit A
VEDFELARAARRVIITCEQVVDTEDVRCEPWRTAIPFYLVDAVCEVRYGAHPTQMSCQYFFDEEHIAEWFELGKTDEGAAAYFEKYVFGVADFTEYLERIGGEEQMDYLRRVEDYRAPMKAPWLKR